MWTNCESIVASTADTSGIGDYTGVLFERCDTDVGGVVQNSDSTAS